MDQPAQNPESDKNSPLDTVSVPPPPLIDIPEPPPPPTTPGPAFSPLPMSTPTAETQEPTIVPPPSEIHTSSGGDNKKYFQWAGFGFLAIALIIAGYLAVAKFYLNTWPFAETVQPVVQQPVQQAAVVQSSPTPVGMSLQDISKKLNPIDYQDSEKRKLVNADPSTQTVEYKNEKAGISFNVPYSSNWGVGAVHPQTYDEDYIFDGSSVLRFGPIFVCGEGAFNCSGVSWTREYTMILAQAKTKEEELQRLKKEKGTTVSSEPQIEYSEMVINNLTVIKYVYPGFGTLYGYEVFGKKFNYKFESSSDQQELFTKIIESIKLLD